MNIDGGFWTDSKQRVAERLQVEGDERIPYEGYHHGLLSGGGTPDGE